MKNMKAGTALQLSVLILLIIIIITYGLWLPVPGTFLLVKDNIQKADCVVPLGGEPYFRYKKAVELYEQGYSKNIVVSVTPERQEELREYYNFKYRLLGIEDLSPRELASRGFKYFGKDSHGLYFTDYEVTSTYDEAVATRDLVLKKGFKSLILVTSTYHMRRAMMIFHFVFKGTGVEIYNCTAESVLWNPRQWWLKERDLKVISQEYLSIAYNIFYHFILRKGRTSFDTF